MEFKERLKELIELKNDGSQKNLSIATGIPTSTINCWFTKDIKPTYVQIIKLAQYFCVTTDYLLGLEDDFGHKEEVIRRPTYEVTDKSLQNIIKLFGVMSELQKAHVLGYVVAYLEREGVNVGKVLGY